MFADLDNVFWFLTPSGLPPGVSASRLTGLFLARFLAYAAIAAGATLWGLRRRHHRTVAILIGALIVPVMGFVAPLQGNHVGDWPSEFMNFVWHIGPAFRTEEVLGTLPFYWLGSILDGRAITPLAFARGLACAGCLGGLGLAGLAITLCCGATDRKSRRILETDDGRYLLAMAVVCQPVAFVYAGLLQVSYVVCVLAPWALWAAVRVLFADPAAKRPPMRWGVAAVLMALTAHFSHPALVPLVAAMAPLLVLASLVHAATRRWQFAVEYLAVAVVFVSGFWAFDAAIKAVCTRFQGVDLGGLTHLNKLPEWFPFFQGGTGAREQVEVLTWGWIVFTASTVAHICCPVLLVFALRRMWREKFATLAAWTVILPVGACLAVLSLHSPDVGYPIDADVIVVSGLIMTAMSLAYIYLGPTDGAQAAYAPGVRWAWTILAYSIVCTAGLWALQDTHAPYHLYYGRLSGSKELQQALDPNQVPRQSAAFAGRIGFPVKPLARFEPLFTSGWWGRGVIGDFVYVEYLEDRAVLFRYDHSGQTKTSSAPLSVPPGEINDIVIAVDKANDRITVVFAGKEVLRYEGYIHPFDSGGVAVGWNRLGWPRAAGVFSGQLQGQIGFGPLFPNGWEGLWRPGYD